MPTPPAIRSTLRRRAPRSGERAVGALGENARPGLKAGSAALCDPANLDRDPELVRPGCGRQRVRVRSPPEFTGEESPTEELAGLGAQFVEVLAARCRPTRCRRSRDAPPQRAVDGGCAARSGAHRRYQKSRPATADVHGRPQPAGLGVVDEVGAGRELMAERQRDGEVGVQVDEVPRLVAQACAAPLART